MPDSPFYLGINNSANATIWFKNIAMGEGKIRTLMKTAANKASIKGKKTNKSFWKKNRNK
jgi:hypothetical protein